MASELGKCQHQKQQRKQQQQQTSGPKRRRLEDDCPVPGDESAEISPMTFFSGNSPMPGQLKTTRGCLEVNETVKPLTTSTVASSLSSSSSSSSSSDLMNPLTTPTQIDLLSDDTGFPPDTADEEKDDVSSTVSNLSDITGISVLSDDGDDSIEWRNASSWVQKQIQLGTDPRDVLKLLSSDPTPIPEELDDITLWRHVIDIMSEPPKRQKLCHINTICDVVELIKKSRNIIVLTGAGVSVSCGIPDFRSRDGIYARLAQDFPDLPDPQAMFDINYFSQDPRPFYKFAREIYPGQFKPSPCHKFIKMLEKQNKLLRNYSQNIDTLERVAGIENLIECHGSFATASCTKCKFQVNSDDVKKEISAQIIPLCPKCHDKKSVSSITEINLDVNYRDLVAQGVMKPDIVFFGEGLPDDFHDAMANDKDVCDLLIVIGSSLKVRPVALIPSSIPHSVPQILINRESLPHLEFDVELLGDGDVVINQLCHMLDGSFKEVCWRDTILVEANSLLPSLTDSWDQSQDASTSQDFSQDSDIHIQQDHFSVESSSKKQFRLIAQREQDEEISEGQRWKKFKNDPESSEFEEKPSSCSEILDFVEKKKKITNQECVVQYDSSIHHVSNYLVNEGKKIKAEVSGSSFSSNDDNNSRNDNCPNDHGITENNENDEFLETKFWIKSDRNEATLINENSIHHVRYNIAKNMGHMEARNLEFRQEGEKEEKKDNENVADVKGFKLHAQDDKRQINLLSYDENVLSSKVSIRLESNRNTERKRVVNSDNASPTTSYESTTTIESTCISEECHVVPRLDCLKNDSTLDGTLDPCKSCDKSDLKPRHSSIDSVMDSALGDSCSSSECQKRKIDETDDKKKCHSHLWQSFNKDSLATRLPENSYYQMKPGRYIFPGAEIYLNFPWNEGFLEISGLKSALTENQLCKQ